jgi:ABC-type uncharacterized transport system fused permease/ATPase subunit
MTGEFLNTRLRKNVAAEFHRLLLGEKKLYKLSVPSGYGDNIDNHDQRMSEDLQRTLDEGIGIMFGNYIVQPALFLTLYRSIISLERAYNRIFDYEREDVNLAFILTTIGLAVSSFCIYVLTMNLISVVLFNQKKYEGNLRWSHARVLNFVEPVCLYGGENQEGAQADDRFSECYTNYKYLALLQSSLAGWTVVYRTVPSAIRYHFVALTKVPSFQQFSLSGYISTGLTDMVQFIIEYSYFSRAGGECHRVGELLELLQGDLEDEPLTSVAVDTMDSEAKAPLLISRVDAADSQAQNGSAVIAFDRVSVSAPCSDELILNNVTFSIDEGDSICFLGPSGCGKTTIMRLMAGLWEPSAGTVRRPTLIGKGGLFFSPPRPYVTIGTLREQIMYPGTHRQGGSKQDDDFFITKIMREVNLGWLLDMHGLDRPGNWSEMLSGGEMQRMGFARLFYHQPKYAIMDESLSALDEALEAKMLLMMHERNIKMISVVHRETAVNFHDRILKFDSKSRTWQMVDVSAEKKAAAMDNARSLAATILAESDADPEGARSADKEEVKKAGMDMLFVSRLWEMTKLAIPTYTCKTAYILYLLISVNICRAVVIIYQADYSGDLVDGLFNEDTGPLWWNKIIFFYASALLSGMLSSVSSYCGQRLALSTRAACMKNIHSNYFRPKVPYAVSVVDGLDTVDQRAVGDLFQFTDFLWLCIYGGPSYTGPGLFPGMLQIVILLIRGYLVSWVTMTALLGTIIFCNIMVVFFGLWLAPAISARANAEGLYRTVHTGIREYAEAITFYGGEDSEQKRADKVMREHVTPCKYDVAYLSFGNNCASLIIQYAYNMGLIALNVSAYYYDPGRVPDSITYSQMITFVFVAGGNLAQVAQAFKTLPLLAGYTHRVYELMESSERGSEHAKRIDDRTEITEGRVAIVDGKLTIPGSSKVLFSNLNLSVERGNSLIIMGPSGVGKSSLLRAISGLWALDEGKLLRPDGIEHFLFVPQRPYATEGSLRQQLIYPHTESTAPDELLMELLDLVGLTHLHDKWSFDKVTTWDDKLSTGEAQRLGFVRVLYHKPTFALLDEATSALDFMLEDKLMTRCLEQGITMISVAHRSTQIKYHRQMLKIISKNDFTVQKIES